MNYKYKLFAYTFLIFQSIMIFGSFSDKNYPKNYTFEVVSEIIFTISKINHTYNFFTSSSKKSKYSYVSNDIYLVDKNKIHKLRISKDGSIKHISNFFNASRLTHIQNLATSDTLLYNAVVRSEALYFSKRHKTFPLIYFEVVNHSCIVKKEKSKFKKFETLTPIYSNYFILKE